jgi:hypothetical protein
LVEDLKELWYNDGVQVWDEHKHEYFSLKAILFVIVSDSLASRNLCGHSKKVGCGCPHCFRETYSQYLSESQKIVYMGHRRYIPMKHQFQSMKDQFNGNTERRHPPPYLTCHEVYEMVKDVHVVLGKWKRTGKKTEEDDMWNKQSIFWELPYWKDLDVRHSIDVMHIEKNVCESLLGTLLNMDGKTRDHGHAWADLKKMGIRPELWLDDSVKGTELPTSYIHIMSVKEYVTKFTQLSLYAPHEVDTDEKKQDCFLNGLNDGLAYALEAQDFENFQGMVNKALLLENHRGVIERKRELVR